MRGLLVKDLRLLRNQKQFFLTVIMIAAVFMLAGQDMSFIVSYCSILAMFFAISTISYDEFNNGYAKLFTMPITRKQYVMEKYLFALLLGGGVWAAAALLGAVIDAARDAEFVPVEWFASSAAVFAVMWTLMMVMIPINLKYGTEKSRSASLVLMFVVFAVIMMLAKFEPLTLAFQNAVARLEQLSGIGVLLSGAAALAAVTIISMAAGVRTMSKKQF